MILEVGCVRGVAGIAEGRGGTMVGYPSRRRSVHVLSVFLRCMEWSKSEVPDAWYNNLKSKLAKAAASE